MRSAPAGFSLAAAVAAAWASALPVDAGAGSPLRLRGSDPRAAGAAANPRPPGQGGRVLMPMPGHGDTTMFRPLSCNEGMVDNPCEHPHAVSFKDVVLPVALASPTGRSALLRPPVASQSSTGWGGDASRAIDGRDKYDWDSGSVQHTDDEDEAWWMVDLGYEAPIQAVEVYNRKDSCCMFRMEGANVEVLDDGMEVLDSKPVVGVKDVYPFEFGGVVGRYVRIKRTTYGALNIAEVNVTSDHIFAEATQSSTGWGGDASRAIDGSEQVSFYSNSVQHTLDEEEAWWMVDLRSAVAIGTVVVLNRGDCCKDRIVGANIEVLGEDMEVLEKRPFEDTKDMYTFDFVSVVGRYVRIIRTTFGPLNFAEVKVFRGLEAATSPGTYEHKVRLHTDVAEMAHAFHSATCEGGADANAATSGASDDLFAHTCVDPETNALYWQVDFVEPSAIARVEIASSKNYEHFLTHAVMELLDSTGSIVAAEMIGMLTPHMCSGTPGLQVDKICNASKKTEVHFSGTEASAVRIRHDVTGYRAVCGTAYYFWHTADIRRPACGNTRELTSHPDSKHAVRCCSDVMIDGWSKKSGCDFWVRSELGSCHFEKTHAEAEAICHAEGARLCTAEELLREDCTKGSGCQKFDDDLIWSSTSADMEFRISRVRAWSPSDSEYATGEAHVPCGVCAVVDYEDGEVVTIPHGINVEGMLYFPPNTSLELRTPHIFVQGVLKIDRPDDANNRIKFHLTNDGGKDQRMIPHSDNADACDLDGCNYQEKVVAVAGGKLEIEALPEPSCPAWTSLKDIIGEEEGTYQELEVGPQAAGCWSRRLGDEVLITDTVHIGVPYKSLTAIIKSANVTAGTVTLASPPIDKDGNPSAAYISTLANDAKFPAEVAWLSRSVIFDADVTAHNCGKKRGGHMIIDHTSMVAQKIEGVEFRNFGQGGLLGRYPVHFHMSADVSGSEVRKNVVRDSHQRCFVIHRTNNVRIEENVAFNHVGHCFMLEDGVETGNTFEKNLGTGGWLHACVENILGHKGDVRASTFWISNMTNHYIGNVAAGSINGFWFDPKQPPKTTWQNVAQNLPIETFRDNIAHSNLGEGIKLYRGGYRPASETLLENTKAYRNYRQGVRLHVNKNLVFKGLVLADNRIGISSFDNVGYANNQVDGEGRIRFEDTLIIGLTEKSRKLYRLDSTTGQMIVNPYPVFNQNVAGVTEVPNDQKNNYIVDGLLFAQDPLFTQLILRNVSFSGFGPHKSTQEYDILAMRPWEKKPGAHNAEGSTLGSADKRFHDMPTLDGVYMDSPINSFDIEDNDEVNNLFYGMYLQDVNGTMHSSGQGAFVSKYSPPSFIYLRENVCEQANNRSNSAALFCRGCIRKVIFYSGCKGDLVIKGRDTGGESAIPGGSQWSDSSTYTHRAFLPLDDFKISCKDENGTITNPGYADMRFEGSSHYIHSNRGYRGTYEKPPPMCNPYVNQSNFALEEHPVHHRYQGNGAVAFCCSEWNGVVFHESHVSIRDRRWVTYGPINFGDPGELGSILVRYWVNKNDGTLDLTLDDGTALADKVETFDGLGFLEIPITQPVEGLHKVTFKPVQGHDNLVFHLHWFELLPPHDSSSLTELAEAAQSSTCSNGRHGEASFAIDDRFHKSSLTCAEDEPWWEVDLRAHGVIDAIDLYISSSDDKDRMKGCVIEIINADGILVMNQTIEEEKAWYHFDFENVKGRRIKISKKEHGRLNIAEVRISGHATTLGPTESPTLGPTISNSPTFAVGYNFIGCYEDQQCRDLPVKIGSLPQKGISPENYHEVCFQRCLVEGYAYFGLQYLGECRCGSSYGKHGSTTCKNEVNECAVGDTQFGGWKNCVYEIRGLDTLKTPDNNKHWAEFATDLSDGEGSLEFEVQANNDAHIALGPSGPWGCGRNIPQHYEIVLGGWSNEQSVMRYETGEEWTSNYSGEVLHGNEYRRFRISWDPSILKVEKYSGTTWSHVMQLDRIQEGSHYYIACGAQKCNYYHKYKAAGIMERQRVRCCADSALGDGWVGHCAGMNVWGESEINGDCYNEETHESAEQLCQSVGAKLCTKDELLSGCTGGSGCQSDWHRVWSATPLEPRTIERAMVMTGWGSTGLWRKLD